MFCEHCGKPYQAGDAFCPHCGGAIKAVQPPVTGAVVPVASAAPSVPMATMPAPARTINKKVWIIGGIAAVAVVVAVVLILVFTLGAGNPRDAVQNFAESMTQHDYKGIKKGLIYDLDQMLYDSFAAHCMEEGMSMTQGLAELSSDYGYVFTDPKKLGRDMCEYAKMQRAQSLYTSTVTASTPRPITTMQMYEALEELAQDMKYMDVNLYNYVNPAEIKEAYEVDVLINWRDSMYGDSDQELETLVVVKYKGQWKVLCPFDVY